MIVRGSGDGQPVTAYLRPLQSSNANEHIQRRRASASVSEGCYTSPYLSASARKIVVPQFTTFQPRNFYRSGNDCINKITWSCDGKRLASCSNSKEVKLWDIERSLDNADLSLSGTNKDPMNHVACHPMHPQLLCSASRKAGQIYFWDARRFKRSFTRFPLLSIPLLTHQMLRPCFAMDRMDNMRIIDCRMVGSSEPNEWSLREESLRLGSDAGGDSQVYQAIFNHVGICLPAHVTACYTLALDPRGSYLASGGADGFVNLFDTAEFIASKTVPTIDSGIRTIGFSHDGEYIAAGCAEQSSVFIICTETGELMHRIPCLGTPSTVAWHPTRHLLAFAEITNTALSAVEGG
ncbi:WD40 repeat-like protein [Rhizoctonia solani]|uniref:WD40 repeat-like protein n=1 Tax=Rhizoctonia solani TaxID=456999 RepID=A0A8H7IJT8_9AGAM|nr:WD40 repeat-like protein [Rhizoctonia solani]